MPKRKYPQKYYDERIRPLLDAKPGTNREKEAAMGIPDKIISNWNNLHLGSWSNYLRELSLFLGVSIEYMIFETDDPTPHPTVSHSYFIPPEIADDTVQMPVIGGVAAGYERIAYEDWTGDSIEIPRSYLHGHEPQEYFVLHVKGNSMYPDYQEGDHVLVFRQDTMDRSGQVGVVIYGDECGTLKRVEYVQGEDWMTLRPINPNFPPITIRGEELEHCKVLGIAKMVIRELDQ